MERDLDHPHVVGLLEGMRSSKPDSMTVLYSRGCDWTEKIETQYTREATSEPGSMRYCTVRWMLAKRPIGLKRCRWLKRPM